MAKEKDEDAKRNPESKGEPHSGGRRRRRFQAGSEKPGESYPTTRGMIPGQTPGS